MKKLVVLSGSGISAESGLKTFREADGLWEGHDIMEVASPLGWQKDREAVLAFYNQRRRQLQHAEPNKAHVLLAQLQPHFDVHIITQNVDDLHERAGSKQVLHLHGELLKVRSVHNENLIYSWTGDLTANDTAEDGSALRPHIVWFGEDVPLLPVAANIVAQADIFLIIGTSLVVYPAAGLVRYAPPTSTIYIIDIHQPEIVLSSNITFIQEKATAGMQQLSKKYLRIDSI